MKDNSATNSISVIVVAVIGVSLGAVQEAAAKGCETTSKTCVEVGFPGETGRPTVDEESVHVSKSEGEFAFGFKPSEIGKAYVIFKCQDEANYPNDCRTPLKNGRWVVPLVGGGSGNGKAKGIEINDTLERCDLCADVVDEENHKECLQNACQYPYMIVDETGKRPPLDPLVIVDPR